jgi:hypothetical protein
MVSRVKLVAPWQTGTNPVGIQLPTDNPAAASTTWGYLPIVSGSVVQDATADVTSTASITAMLDWPAKPTSIGSPYGSELFIELGVQYANGTREYVGLGYFRINDDGQDLVNGGPITMNTEDRMANIRDGRPLFPQVFGDGASFQGVVDFVVNDVMPGVPVVYDFAASTTLLVGNHVLEDDRVKFLQELTTAYGKIMYFDYAGRLQVKSPPSQTNPPVYTIKAGAYGTLASMKRNISRDGVYNGAVAKGDPASDIPPVSGFALDLDPASPTYWFGPFGKVPEYFSSTFLTTDDQCAGAAAAMRVKQNGAPYTVNLTATPNPALEVSDVVTITYDVDQPDETHIVDRITLGLTSGDATMSIDTRKQYLK